MNYLRFPLPVRPIVAVAAALVAFTACSDVDVDSALAETVRTRVESATAAPADGDGLGEAVEMVPFVGDSGPIEPTPLPVVTAEPTPWPVEEALSASDSGDLASEDDGDELAGEEAVVTVGVWTVNREDLGVRIRATPAGDIVGFIVRGDAVRTTGAGRIVNRLPWGEIEHPDGTIGWISLDPLEAIADETFIEQQAKFQPVTDGAVADSAVTDSAGADVGDDTTSDTGDGAADSTDSYVIDGDGPADEVTIRTEAAIEAAASQLEDENASMPGDDFSFDDLTRRTVQTQTVFVSADEPSAALLHIPSTDGDVVTTAASGERMEILSPDAYRNGDITYVYVSFEGIEGWVNATSVVTR